MLSKQLKRLRAQQDYTQSGLARQLGVTQQAVARWETDKSSPDPTMLIKIASLLKVSVDELVGNTQEASLSSSQGVKIPVLGSVVAGVPIEAITDILGYEEITPQLSRTGKFFALRIKGESMTPRFEEGDIVIVKQQPDVESGDIAIILINGSEATVKQVKKTKEGIVLYGYNPTVYAPHFYTNQEIMELPVQIIGKVVESRRRY